MPSIQFTSNDGTSLTPFRASKGASGVDLSASISQPLYVFPKQAVLVPTGLRVCIPVGYELQIRPRSGVSFRNQVLLPNAPGTIDSDYRGEIQIIMRNIGDSIFVIRPHDRIAQMVCAASLQAHWQSRSVLPESARGRGGFGSTGKR